MFNVGIGPSSSHAVGPMRAALRFVRGLERDGRLEATARVHVELFGSLGITGKGHGSDIAVMLGLSGATPEDVEPDEVPGRIAAIERARSLSLLGRRPIAFEPAASIVMHRKLTLPLHPNGMRFVALGEDGAEIARREYYSVGGGFVVD